MQGVVYKITKVKNYDASSDTWTTISNPTTITKTTNSQGLIKINGIELGTYKIQETAGPPNVVLNTNAFTVDVPMLTENADGSQYYNYDVHIYPKNEIIRGSVTLHKKNGEMDGTDLAGATFKLFKVKDGNDELIQKNLTTGSQGEINVDNLLYGDYYFVETSAPEGFMNRAVILSSLLQNKVRMRLSMYGTILIQVVTSPYPASKSNKAKPATILIRIQHSHITLMSICQVISLITSHLLLQIR